MTSLCSWSEWLPSSNTSATLSSRLKELLLLQSTLRDVIMGSRLQVWLQIDANGLTSLS